MVSGGYDRVDDQIVIASLLRLRAESTDKRPMSAFVRPSGAGPMAGCRLDDG